MYFSLFVIGREIVSQLYVGQYLPDCPNLDINTKNCPCTYNL